MRQLKLKINDKVYTFNEQYITGLEVKMLGGIPESDILFLQIKKPWEDELIENDTKIDLARPGIEKFYSADNEGHYSVIIIVNGREKEWRNRKISYAQVAKLAFPDYGSNNNIVYTVSYTDGPGQNPEGSMVAGDEVFVKPKMKFNVSATNRA